MKLDSQKNWKPICENEKIKKMGEKNNSVELLWDTGHYAPFQNGTELHLEILFTDDASNNE